MTKSPLRVIPLGGLGEIGKNMMALECGDDIVVVDGGVMFPGDNLPGIDLIIPDISYLVANRPKVRGIVITHGHEDHTGALPFVVQQLRVPIYAPRLAEGLIADKLKERKVMRYTELKEARPGHPIKLGSFEIEMFRVCHSIPDAMGLAIRTPVGMVVHTGDFKFDHTPVDGQPSDFIKLADLGSRGVLLLMSDSTYAEVPGYTPSEKVVGEALDHIVARAEGRVIIATFASLISRIQQVVDAAVKHGRKVCIEGRSMVDAVKMAIKLGYLYIPQGVQIGLDAIRSLPSKDVVILLTGTQGEPSSALARVANEEHKHIRIIKGDTVVMSATPIPGNHLVINDTIDKLFRLGANVLYEKIAQVHVHGHAAQEELKMMLSLIRPKFFVPIHGEYRHQVLHTQLAQSLGLSPEHTFVLQNGDVLEVTPTKARVADKVQAGPVYIDGLGTWGLHSTVLQDRKSLAADGIVVVGIAVDRKRGHVVGLPRISTQGFVDQEEADSIIEESQEALKSALNGHRPGTTKEEVVIALTKVLSKLYLKKTRRHPTILPVTVEV